MPLLLIRFLSFNIFNDTCYFPSLFTALKNGSGLEKEMREGDFAKKLGEFVKQEKN